MPQESEWRLDLYRDVSGEVFAALYGFRGDGQCSLIADERYGPFDTATDIATWLVRHWGPRSGLPLR